MISSMRCLLVVLLVLGCTGASGGKQPVRGSRAYRQSISEHLAAVSKSQYSMEQTRDVLGSLEGAARQRTDGPQWEQVRKDETILILRLVARATHLLDPAFDPSNVPALSVLPPPGSGFSRPVDPSEIRDVKLRRDYEEAIAENQRKADQYRREHRLRMMHVQIVARAREYLIELYRLPPSRTADLRKVLEDEGWDEKSITELLSEIEVRHPGKR